MQETMTQPYPAVDQPKSNCDPTSCPTQPNPTEAQLYPAAAEREREIATKVASSKMAVQ